MTTTTVISDYQDTTQIDSRTIYLSTKSSSGNVLNGDMKSDVIYNLKNYLNYEDDRSVQYITISVPYAVLVNSNYIINQYNNVLNIRVGGTITSYQFPYGNYTALSFIQAFKTVVIGYTLTINEITSKFSVQGTGSFTLLGTSSIDYLMGFSDDVSSVGTIAAMPRLCNFLPCASFQICTVGGMIYNGAILANDGVSSQSNVLCSVPNSSRLNTQIVYSGNNDEFRLSSKSQSFLQIQILDNGNNLVDFNGIACFFSLKINVYRKVLKYIGKFETILKNAIINNVPEEKISDANV